MPGKRSLWNSPGPTSSGGCYCPDHVDRGHSRSSCAIDAKICKQLDLLDGLSGVNHLMAGGGAISTTLGDALATKTRLNNVLGTMEISTLTRLEVATED